MAHAKKIITTVLIAGSVWLTPAYASDLPAPLDKALSEAENSGKLRFSYTQEFIWADHAPIIERFDAATGKWTLISGTPDALDKKGRKKLRNWKRIESAPGELLYADYRSTFKDTKLAEETEDAWHYSFTAGQAKRDDLADGASEKVLTRSTVNKDDGSMSYFLIQAMEGFKPNPVSRLDEFVFEQSFERPAPDLPPVMTKVFWRAKGKQMMSNVDEEYTIHYSDFVLVE